MPEASDFGEKRSAISQWENVTVSSSYEVRCKSVADLTVLKSQPRRKRCGSFILKSDTAYGVYFLIRTHIHIRNRLLKVVAVLIAMACVILLVQKFNDFLFKIV